MITLKRQHASRKIWSFFISTFFLSGIVVWFLNEAILIDTHPVLNIVLSGLILAIANILFVEYQIMSKKIDQPETKVKNMKWIIIVCVAAVATTAVVLLFVFLLPDRSIEDTNGIENTNLAVLTLDDLLSYDNYSAYMSHASHEGASTSVKGTKKEYDYQYCSFGCKEISGVKTIQVTKSTENQISLNISSQVEEGNMEIVIIIDDIYYDHVPVNQDCSVILNDVAEKEVVVKIGAESAKMQITVERGQGDGSPS